MASRAAKGRHLEMTVSDNKDALRLRRDVDCPGRVTLRELRGRSLANVTPSSEVFFCGAVFHTSIDTFCCPATARERPLF